MFILHVTNVMKILKLNLASINEYFKTLYSL